MDTPAALALGTATFGREVDLPVAHQLLDHAFAAGIRDLDTAALYSAGTSERIIGAWIRAHPERRAHVRIATKIYPPYTPEAIAAAVGTALQNLAVDDLDLLYLHKWDAAAATPDTLRALDALRQRGLVRALGLSNASQAQLASALAVQRQEGLTAFTWLQNNHNFAVRAAGPELRRFCRSQGVQVITYSPLGAGFLTGKHARGVEPGSRFAVSPAHGDIYFKPECWARLAFLEATARKHGLDQALLAFAWVLRQPGIDHVLVGARRPEQIDQALAAQQLDAAPALAELDAYVDAPSAD